MVNTVLTAAALVGHFRADKPGCQQTRRGHTTIATVFRCVSSSRLRVREATSETYNPATAEGSGSNLRDVQSRHGRGFGKQLKRRTIPPRPALQLS
ncbi:hypothetical protein ElyMa_001272400 [Elysia marginata]|uniref:Secreted protein n=1 Tax=Elysia marginata TaxID=1093978 RepID=A0AAV4ICZ0_9GAST|nr:hypothetical protein ElyMa_001272400 [Elysia marginata]